MGVGEDEGGRKIKHKQRSFIGQQNHLALLQNKGLGRAFYLRTEKVFQIPVAKMP